MSGLPKGWAETTLGAVIDYGKTEKVEPDTIADDAWILELEDIEKDTSKIVSRASFGERKSKSTKNRFLRGDVLYGKLRPYLNKVVVADADGYCTTEIIPIGPTEATENRYVFHWLKHPRFLDYVTEVSHGLNMPRLGTEAGKAAPFVLAPLPEQTRIADKLDALLARVDAARERLARVPALLKRFRQSVLAAATSGELTEDWRNDKPTAWEDAPLSELCEQGRVITYGVVKLGDEVPSGIPCLRTSNVRWLDIEVDEIKRIAKSLSDSYGRTILRGGEVLVNVRGTLGGVAVVDKSMTGWNVSREVAVVPANAGKVNSKFLALFVACNKSQKWLTSVQKGVAYTGINIEDLRTLPVSLPSIDEQHEIVRRVEALFALADKVQTQYEAARARVDKLTPALLAKAFRGELVPQDPNDEPAAKLLERLRADKASEPKPVKQGRKSPATVRKGRKTS